MTTWLRQPGRIGRSRLVKGEECQGKIASKRRFFFGFQPGRRTVQLVTTRDKQPVHFFILPGSYVDVTALQMMHLDLPAGSKVYGDRATPITTGAPERQEGLYFECEDISLKIQRKSNSQRPDQAWEAAYKKQLRQRIEQAFSQITMRFPKKIHAITEAGFLIKIAGLCPRNKLVSYNVDYIINSVSDYL